MTFLLNSCKLIPVVKHYDFTRNTQRRIPREKSDLSHDDIAENYGISRQGVRDVIVRAEAYMTEIEDKTGLVKRFMQRTPHLERIEAAADELRRLNDRRYEDSRIAELVTVIEQETAALKE